MKKSFLESKKSAKEWLIELDNNKPRYELDLIKVKVLIKQKSYKLALSKLLDELGKLSLNIDNIQNNYSFKITREDFLKELNYIYKNVTNYNKSLKSSSLILNYNDFSNQYETFIDGLFNLCKEADIILKNAYL